MFLFGLKMLWEAWRMGSDEAEETRREVEQELGVCGDTVSTEDTGAGPVCSIYHINMSVS